MVTLALGGDTMLGRLVGEALLERPPESVWSDELRAVFAEADATIVNLECCISERGEPWDPWHKPFHFRAPPAAVDALRAANVAAVWLANNHALDFGPLALLDTFDHLERAGIVWAGAGRTLGEARTGRILELSGARIGLVGFADHPSDFAATEDRPGIAWVPLDAGVPDWLEREVARLAGQCDLVIAGPHWGPNMRPRPLPHHPAVARQLVAAGLGALAGHSAHVFQGIELVDGVPILYDLGDLLDDYRVDPELRNDLGILCLLTPGERLEIVPLKLEFTMTRLAGGADRRWIVERLVTASRELGTELRHEGERLVVDLPARAPRAYREPAREGR